MTEAVKDEGGGYDFIFLFVILQLLVIRLRVEENVDYHVTHSFSLWSTLTKDKSRAFLVIVLNDCIQSVCPKSYTIV